MGSAVDSTDPRERRGLSRRDMIKGAAVAGAAAWTAPMIIDSLSSPAAAGSCGNRYYLKLVARGTGTSQAEGTCYNAGPLCNNAGSSATTVPSGSNTGTCTSGGDYIWVCTGGTGHTTKGWPTSIVDSNVGVDGTGTYTITLGSGCSFDASTSFKAVGNYNWTGSGGNCKDVSPVPANGATSVVFQKTVSSTILDYMYLEFVCI